MSVMAPRWRVEQAEKVVSIFAGRDRRRARREQELNVELSKLHARVAYARAQVARCLEAVS